jgi:hypothetical protein
MYMNITNLLLPKQNPFIMDNQGILVRNDNFTDSKHKIDEMKLAQDLCNLTSPVLNDSHIDDRIYKDIVIQIRGYLVSSIQNELKQCNVSSLKYQKLKLYIDNVPSSNDYHFTTDNKYATFKLLCEAVNMDTFSFFKNWYVTCT